VRKHAIVPPFRALDPELGVAERLLRKGNPELCGIAAQLPDEHAAARRLNAVLAAAGARPRLVDTGAAWRIVYVTSLMSESELAAGAAGLAELVTVGGWWRVKRCATATSGASPRSRGLRHPEPPKARERPAVLRPHVGLHPQVVHRTPSGLERGGLGSSPQQRLAPSRWSTTGKRRRGRHRAPG
jgi:hypothetical protein